MAVVPVDAPSSVTSRDPYGKETFCVFSSGNVKLVVFVNWLYTSLF
jgi:hypothetical protein